MTELNDHSAREHALLSASSAHRWLACPPSAVAAELYPNQDTEFTREGTLAHEVAERVAAERLGLLPSGERAPWPEGVTAEMLECAAEYADYLMEQIRGPQAYVRLEQRVDFSDWVPDGFGTCDCAVVQGATLDVIDYKYGQGVPVDADHNPQLMLYALGAYKAVEGIYDIERVRLHIYQPRINNISVWETRLDDLLTWAIGGVAPIAAEAYQGKGEYRAGEHCRFCPHAGRCPELTHMCTEFVQLHNLRLAVPVTAPHEVAEVLSMEPVIALWLKRVKDQALTSMLGGVEIPGYKVVEGRPGNRKWTDDLQVAELLKGAGYKLEEITETKLLSPAAMDKALGRKKAAELLEGMTDRSPGAPTIAPAADKRPAYDRTAEAVADFKED